MIDFKNLNIVQENQIRGLIESNKGRQNRLKPIRSFLEDRYFVDSITEINDYQIAKVRRKSGAQEWLYPVFLNYKSLHEMAMTFDQAVLICLAYKYDGNSSDSVTYIERILNARFMPEEID